MDLTTLANAKQWLNITTDTDDALLSRLITAVSGKIQNFINRDLELKAYQETFDGNGKEFLPLQNWPIVSFDGLLIDGQAIGAYDRLNPRASYRLRGSAPDPQAVALFGRVFNKGFGNVQVNYTAGYTPETLPAEIEQACVMQVGIRYRERDRIGQNSKSISVSGGNQSTSFFTGDLHPSVKNDLESYCRRWAYGGNRR